MPGKNFGKGVKVKVTITETDYGMQKIKQQVELLKNKPYVDVGVLGGEHKNPDGSTSPMVLIASVQEYGSPARNIPQRSFIRTTAFENREKIFNFIKELKRRLILGKVGVAQSLGLVGQLVQSMTKKKIIDQDPNWAPLADSTIAAKQAKGSGAGEVKALIDTGQLVNSIKYKVHMKQGEGDE